MNAIFRKLSYRIVAAWQNSPRPWGGGDATGNHGNNVDALRAVLALLVIWFHCPILLGIASDSPLSPAFAQEPTEQVHFVGFRVLCFFWLSGFLLARSWDRSPQLMPFLARRILRLYPAFLVCAALCLMLVFVVSPEAALPGARTVWRYIITLRLPEAGGLFPNNPIPSTVNGALWTLLYEGWCCVALAVLGTLGILRRGAPLLMLFVVVWFFYVLQWFGEVRFPVSGESFQTWIVFGSADAYSPLLACFLSGVVFYRFRERIPWHPALLVLALGGLALSICLGLVGPAIPVFGAYCLAYVAFHPRRLFPLWLSAWGGLSYGIFLYGYPVQQLWVHYASSVAFAPTVLFLLTMAPVLLLAYFSRRFVELPIERWRKQAGKRRARPAPAEMASSPAQLQIGVRQAP